MSEKETKPSLESTLKSMDTEEFIDIHFYRPIGYRWALLFRRLGISPNSVTIASIFIGIASGICFYPHDLTINIIGMLLLVWANSYDSADGQLARMTGQKSALGRILDGHLVHHHLCRYLSSFDTAMGHLDLGLRPDHRHVPQQTGGDGRLLPEHSPALPEGKRWQRALTFTCAEGEFQEDELEKGVYLQAL